VIQPVQVRPAQAEPAISFTNPPKSTVLGHIDNTYAAGLTLVWSCALSWSAKDCFSLGLEHTIAS
jgi:hypothetical protein